jgi:mannosyltransferase OCH1-like enzyme
MLKKIILIIILVVLIVLFVFNSMILWNLITSQTHIPKIIWTYWEGDMPLVVHLCIDSWRKYNAEYNIIVLNEHNLARYTDLDFSTLKHARDSPARFSDYVRLNVLSQYGGIWMDASIIAQASITPLLFNEYVMTGFYLDGFTSIPHSKVIESWFIACPQNSEFVKAWAAEFMRTNEYDSIDDYIKDVQQTTHFQKINQPNYLCIHISAQKVLQEQPCVPSKLLLYKAENTAYKYLTDAAWDSKRAIQLLQHPSPYNYLPVLKMRSGERNELAAQPDHTIFFPHIQQNQSKTTIPCIIWTYWEGVMPMLTHLCIDSWRKHNLDYEIIIVTKSTLSKYINEDIDKLKHANESPARFSDFVRLHILARHGGIWMDATVICHESFAWLHDLQKKHQFQFLGYKMKNHTQPKCKDINDVVESCVFACTPLCPIVTAWRDEFMKLNDFETADAYIQSVKERGINLQDSPGAHGYWAIFTSFLTVIQTHPEFNSLMFLLEGTETIYKWQFDLEKEGHKAQVRHLLEDRYVTEPLIKLTNWDRKELIAQEPDVSVLFDP